MSISYISTRGQAASLDFENVLVTGLASDGGLYVPKNLPFWNKQALRTLRGLSYVELARCILSDFVETLMDSSALYDLLQQSYNRFTHHAVVPLVQLDQRLWLLELFHGPTLSFKDIPLQVLGRLFASIAKRDNRRCAVLSATSGDTGSAVIEAFQGCQGVEIFVLYPKGRISPVQRRQMTTVVAQNVHTLAVEGTFDDCQAIVKALFQDSTLPKDIHLTAANSINWGRIACQVVYYFAAALALGAPERSVAFVVPTGNFGNIYAAYTARAMGLPIQHLISASNHNDSVFRFFTTGTMSLRPVIPSWSPSIDIVVPSNFERFLFDLYERDPIAVTQAMENLKTHKKFSVPQQLLQQAQQTFFAYQVNDTTTCQTIKQIFERTGLLVDPHTAVGLAAALRVRKIIDKDCPIITTACAHPAKFENAVIHATGVSPTLPVVLLDVHQKPEKITVVKNDVKYVKEYIRNILYNNPQS